MARNRGVEGPLCGSLWLHWLPTQVPDVHSEQVERWPLDTEQSITAIAVLPLATCSSTPPHRSPPPTYIFRVPRAPLPSFPNYLISHPFSKPLRLPVHVHVRLVRFSMRRIPAAWKTRKITSRLLVVARLGGSTSTTLLWKLTCNLRLKDAIYIIRGRCNYN